VIIDPYSPDGKEITVFESGAILTYLAEKTGELTLSDPIGRIEVMKWVFWGSTGLSPQMKIFGFYYRYCPHSLPYCVSRYSKEVHRLFGVLESHLATHQKHWVTCYLAMDLWTGSELRGCHVGKNCIYSIEHSGFKLLHVQAVFSNLQEYPLVSAWYNRCINRRASQRSLSICNLFTQPPKV